MPFLSVNRITLKYKIDYLQERIYKRLVIVYKFLVSLVWYNPGSLLSGRGYFMTFTSGEISI
ncbi:hypothetical protein MTsPCn5_11040 [Croceitalea sp. MTPC5]|nr:hypothetical protein MTsPCn5_11040 [Croceitalea sp. MTPC5]